MSRDGSGGIDTRLVRGSQDFVPVTGCRGLGRAALRYGALVDAHSQLPGAHNTPAAEDGNNLIAHQKGKYGEMIFGKWLVDNLLFPSHTPFRNDYREKVDLDDFVVNGVTIEVKAKQRTASPYPPPLHYNVNMGRRGLEHQVYVFVEIDSKTAIEADPPAMLLGWGTPNLVRKSGQETWPGKVSDNGRFPFRRHDWDIKIGSLYRIEHLPGLLRSYDDAVKPPATPRLSPDSSSQS